MGLTEFIVTFATDVISIAGYPGLVVLMAAESMILPVPSEAVMPFAGFLIAEGGMTWAGVILASTLGSLVGSLLSYAIGAYGGRPLVLRWGKYLLLNEHHLELTEKFFHRRGTLAVFVSRFIPVVRHLISIPAGVGRMPLVPFMLVTVIGAGLWNTFLAWVGVQLGAHWEDVVASGETLDKLILVLLFLGLLFWLWRARRRSRTRPPKVLS